MNYTKILLNILMPTNRGIDNKKLNKITINKYPNIYNYIMNIYQDSSSIKETIKRLNLHIDIKPLCPTCGKPVTFIGKPNHLFTKYCSNSCRAKNVENIQKWQQGQQQYNLEHYGVKYNFERNDIIEKRKQTFINKYGTTNTYNIDEIRNKMIQTSLLHYGTLYPSSSTIIRNKIIATWLKKYNADNPVKNAIIAYKISKTHLLPETKKKIYDKKKYNHSFNTSIPEFDSYVLLKKYYPETISQYRSDLYPFNCDFYIPSLDLYIECNYHWTHGGHPYNNIQDYDKLQQIIEKAKTSNYYKNVIKTWTIRDVEKRETAKQNNLNYIEFFTINELKQWLNKKHTTQMN